MHSESVQATLVIRFRIREDAKEDFFKWQARLHRKIADCNGFASLEVLSPTGPAKPDWTIVQCFYKIEDVRLWRESAEWNLLIKDLEQFLERNTKVTEELSSGRDSQKGGVVEVFVTQVSPDKVEEYKSWMGKIHEAESKFPGFQKVHMQAPNQKAGGSWITFLQFDTAENLERWLDSPERRQILEEGESIIHSLESHKVISPFSGWFKDVDDKKAPPLWKQTALILLVLYPIVMLELLYLMPVLGSMNSSLKTFIGNAISVSLISWPMMPVTIYFLRWWLVPSPVNRLKTEFKGLFLVLALYLLEIAIFWNLR